MPQSDYHHPHPSTANVARLREARRELRRAGSALIDVAEFLNGNDYVAATRTLELCDRLLIRLNRAERRAA